jgi:hypothetical protein
MNQFNISRKDYLECQGCGSKKIIMCADNQRLESSYCADCKLIIDFDLSGNGEFYSFIRFEGRNKIRWIDGTTSYINDFKFVFMIDYYLPLNTTVEKLKKLMILQ